MGDFNVTMDVKFMINFCKLNDFSSLIDKPHVTKTLINLTQPVTRCPKWRRSGIFIVNFEHISHLVLVFLLLTLSK